MFLLSNLLQLVPISLYAFEIEQLLFTFLQFLSRLSRSDTRDIRDEDLKNLEHYVVLLYDRSSSLEEVDDCRRSLFTTKGRNIESIPPTKDALIQHSRRALLHGG